MIRVSRALSKAAFPLGLQSGKGVAVGGVVPVSVEVGGAAPDEVFEGVSVGVGVKVREGVSVTVGVAVMVGV